MIGLPPSEAGAVQLTVAWASPALAETPVEAPGPVGGGGGGGGPVGVTAAEGDEAGPVPTALVATTVKV